MLKKGMCYQKGFLYNKYLSILNKSLYYLEVNNDEKQKGPLHLFCAERSNTSVVVVQNQNTDALNKNMHNDPSWTMLLSPFFEIIFKRLTK